MEGTVKWYNRKKGYGFIEGSDGQDYFVHHTALGENVFLNENDPVTFDAADTDRGKQAQHVQKRAGDEAQEKEAAESTEEPAGAEEEAAEEEPEA